jgi:FlaA1/EpsC-like NDP-sugar epimerase
MNLLKAFQGDTFVLMSTDKSVEPVNCYGATKLLAEKLVLEQAYKTTQEKRFMIVRAGNVLGSTGSVIDTWKRQIEANNEITVTNLDMQRFYIEVEQVVKLFMAILNFGENGKIYLVPRGEPTCLKMMTEKVIRLYGNANTKMKIVGLRPGERMKEKMQTGDEKNTVYGFEDMNK